MIVMVIVTLVKSSKVVSSGELVKMTSNRRTKAHESVESNKLVKSREHLKSSELVNSSVRKKKQGR